MPRLPSLNRAPQAPAAASGVSVPTPQGGALGMVGKVAGAIGDDMAAEELGELRRSNEVTRLRIENQYAEAMANAEAELPDNDPTTWGASMAAASQSARDSLLSDDLAPAVRDTLANKLNLFEAKILGDTGRKSKLKDVQILGESYSNRLDSYKQAGLYEDAVNFVHEMSPALEMTEPEIERALQGIADQAKGDLYAERVEEGDSEFFEKQKMAKVDRFRYQRQAKAQKARLQRDETFKAMEGVESEEQLEKRLGQAHHLTDDQKKRIRLNYAEDQPLDLTTRTRLKDALESAYQAYKGGTMELAEYRQRHDEVAQEIYSYGSRDFAGGLRSRAHHLNPDQWADGVPTAPDHADKKSDLNKLTDQWYRAGGFGSLTTGDDLDRDGNQEALINRMQFQDEMESWIERHPEADLEEISDEFRKRTTENMTKGLLIEAGPDYSNRLRNRGKSSSQPTTRRTSAVSEVVTFDLKGKTRDQMPNNVLVGMVGDAAEAHGFKVTVFSGGQPATGDKRTGSHRHDHGNAVDIRLTRDGKRLSASNPADRDYMANFITQAVANGVKGVGCGHGYMNGNIHLDLVGTAHGGARCWGAGGKAKNVPAWVESAFARGLQQRKSR